MNRPQKARLEWPSSNRIVVLSALAIVSVACQVAEHHGAASAASTVDSRMDELKYSRFCTDAAERFWSRHDWKNQQDLHHVDSYTSHYNRNLNKCFVDVHGLVLLKGELLESDHVFDALENTHLGGRDVLRKGGLDGEVESVALIKDGRAIRERQERLSFVPWFQGLMTE